MLCEINLSYLLAYLNGEAKMMSHASLFWFIVPPLLFMAAAVVHYIMTRPKNRGRS
jgi:hypothetical protein